MSFRHSNGLVKAFVEARKAEAAVRNIAKVVVSGRAKGCTVRYSGCGRVENISFDDSKAKFHDVNGKVEPKLVAQAVKEAMLDAQQQMASVKQAEWDNVSHRKVTECMLVGLSKCKCHRPIIEDTTDGYETSRDLAPCAHHLHRIYHHRGYPPTDATCPDLLEPLPHHHFRHAAAREKLMSFPQKLTFPEVHLGGGMKEAKEKREAVRLVYENTFWSGGRMIDSQVDQYAARVPKNSMS